MVEPKLLDQLKKDFPKVRFVEGQEFCWSPQKNAIYYPSAGLEVDKGRWALLHEVAHAKLQHHNYQSDIELVQLEAEAWHHAQKLATNYDLEVDEDHIQDCLDTYRDWLHLRSACPACQTRSFQQDSKTYHCHNCGQSWSVTTSRFCRPYRLKISDNKKSPQTRASKATFV